VGRDGFIASCLRRLRLIHDGARVEQISYAIGVLPYLLRWQPDVVWLQEYTLALLLQRIGKRLGLKCKIIFCNGAPIGPEQCQSFDFIQHLQERSYQDATNFGLKPEMMTILPHCSPVPDLQWKNDSQRSKYGLDKIDWVVVCVAAWNRHHKRIDYLIEEVAALDDQSIKLLLCGQPEEEADSLKQLASEKLAGQVTWLTLPADEIYRVLALSDVFVLPSLTEGLGAVLIEAALCGVPVVCHPHDGGNFVFKECGWALTDLSQKGNLTARLQEHKREPISAEHLQKMRLHARNHFSCPSLAPRFVQMVKHVLQ
jgi:glycosyltransferase involved in cell wall biosynthesis